MKQLRISEPKKLSNNSCVVEPSREDTWRIRAQGEEVTLRWSGEACDATADEMEMIAFRDAVVDIVENSEVYRTCRSASAHMSSMESAAPTLGRCADVLFRSLLADQLHYIRGAFLRHPIDNVRFLDVHDRGALILRGQPEMVRFRLAAGPRQAHVVCRLNDVDDAGLLLRGPNGPRDAVGVLALQR